MSPTPARRPRWLRLLGGLGLAALIFFPWCYAFVPLEFRFSHFGLLPTAATCFQILGLVYTAVFLVILIHEGGHWLFGRFVGIRISDFVVGTGSTGLRFTWSGIRFSFGPWLLGGYVREIPARANLTFWRQLVFLTGGIIAELLFMSALFLVPTLESESFEHAFAILRRFAFASGVIGILSSAWPQMVSLEGKLTPNDALLIRRAWENRRNTDEVWRQIELNDEINQLAQSERYAEAAVVLERMLKSDPRNTAHIATLAALHAAAGNCDQAMLCHRDIIGHTASKSLERVRAIDAAATLALQMGNRDELARMHPLVEEALQIAAQPTVKGTLGSLLVELDDTMAGVKLLNECLAESEADHDRAIANAYLAKAALRMGRKQHAVRLLMFAKSTGGDLPLVQRIAGELEPQLQNAVDDPQLELR